MNNAPTYMTVEAAATHLGVSDRTVRSYMQKELLGSYKKTGSNRKWLLPSDVEELRIDRMENPRSAPAMRKEILQQRAQLRRVRAELNVVMRILDTRNDPLGITPAYAKEIYGYCVAQLQETQWTLEGLVPWVTVFSRLGEDDFGTIRDAVDDPKPWVPFLKLCMRMTRFLVGLSVYKTDPEVQGLHREIAEARRRLRISAMCYMDLHAYDMDELIRRTALADSPRSVNDVLLEMLRKKR